MTKDPKKSAVTDAQKQVYDIVCKCLIEGQPEEIIAQKTKFSSDNQRSQPML